MAIVMIERGCEMNPLKSYHRFMAEEIPFTFEDVRKDWECATAPTGSELMYIGTEGLKEALKFGDQWVSEEGTLDCSVKTVTYDSDGADYVPAPVKVICGTSVSELPTVVKEGYRFVKWKVGENEFTTETVIESDITVIAEFVQLFDLSIEATNASVTVSASGDEIEPGECVLTDGDEITITATADEGYEITSLQVNGEDYTSGTTYTVQSDVIIAVTTEESEDEE